MNLIHFLFHNHVPLFAIIVCVCFVSGFLPFIGTEVYLAIIAIKLSHEQVLPIAIAAASGLMLAKCLIYSMGYGAISLLPKQKKDKLQAFQKKYHKNLLEKKSLLLTSALVGVPPLYVINILCGIFKTRFLKFVSIAFMGTLIRFLFIVSLPQMFMNVFHPGQHFENPFTLTKVERT